MDFESIKNFIIYLQENDPVNKVSEEIAKDPEYIGRSIYSGVTGGVADPCDEILVSLKKNEEANIDLMQPEEWLPGAKSVISFFMPFARWITEENIGGGWPTAAWLHGRIEGQAASNKVVLAITEKIKEEGSCAVAPALDPRFKADKEGCTSNWSERHIAYACGLGTFGLSRGIITELGMAGRLISLVTTLPLQPTPRPYAGLYEYCIRCGACVNSCPVKAISFKKLKDNKLCDAFIDVVRRVEEPYYGCGKCQSGMPCAFGIPKNK